MVIATAPGNDVVFLVEATTNLEASFNELKSNYIIPILNHFSPTVGDDLDLLVDSSSNLYTIVTFTSADSAPHPSVSCAQPSTNCHEMHEALGFINFMQCWNLGASHVTEALATGLQIIDEYKKMRPKSPQPVEKHIILICNSSPYDVPTRETRAYLGLYAADLADKMAERGIHLSIISPRKRPTLYQLFKRVSNPTLPLPNYAVDARHHILLDSIALKEQPRIEKPVRSVIELDNSPNPDLKAPSPTISSHSILESQLKDAQARSSSSSFVPTSGVSVASRTQDSMSAMTPATQVAPLLTEILESAGSTSVDSSPNARKYFREVTPHTSAGAMNIGQANQMTHSRPGNPNQVSMSNANNQQLNQKMPGSTFSVANSVPQAASQANSQMVNAQTSMAGQVSQIPANSIANNQQVMKNSLNPTSIGVSKGMSQGNMASSTGTINSGGLRQPMTRHPNMQNSLSQGGQFNRTINPNQAGQSYTQSGQQLLQHNQGLIQQHVPNQQLSLQNQLQSNTNMPQQQQLSQQQIPQGQQMSQGQLSQGQLQQGQMQQGQMQQGQMQQSQLQQGQIQQGQIQQGQLQQGQMQQGQMQQGQIQPGQMQQGQMQQGQLQQGQMQQGQLQQGQLQQGQLQQGQMQQGQMQQGQMQQGQMQQGQMQQSQMQPGQLQQGQIQQGQVQQGQMSQNQMSQGQMAQGQLTRAQLQQQNKLTGQGQVMQNLLQPSQISQHQVVWQGSLEFCERRANTISPSERTLVMPCKLMADPVFDADLISNGGLFKWPQKISVYPIPEVILTQSLECKRQLTGDTRKLNIFADTNQSSPFRSFVSMLIDKGMAGVINMNAQNEYQIMVLFAPKQQAATNACAMRALLPRQQTLFYDEFKKSVQLYKDKTKMKTAQGNSLRGPAPSGQMIVTMPSHMPSLSQTPQMPSRLPNQAQRQVNPNMPQVIMGSNTNQQGFASTGQMNQGGMQQSAGMQPQGQQMAGLGGQSMMGQQLAGQRTHQNTQMMMRPQMVQQIVQPRQQGQQTAGQPLTGQQIQKQQLQPQQLQNQQLQNQQLQNQQMQNQQLQSQQLQNQQMQNQQMQNQQLQNQQMLMQPNKQSQLLMGGQGQQLDDLQGIFTG